MLFTILLRGELFTIRATPLFYYTKKVTPGKDIKTKAYCIMGNHAHFLLKIEKIEDLSKLMQKVNSIYARYYN